MWLKPWDFTFEKLESTLGNLGGNANYKQSLLFSSPERNMLKGSFCGHQKSVICHVMSVVHHQYLPCGHSGGHMSYLIDLKFDQNVCLDKI